MVDKIGNQIPNIPKAISQAPAAHDNMRGKTSTGEIKSRMDSVNLSYTKETQITYGSAVSPSELANKGYEMLRQLVFSTLEEQGVDFKVATGEEIVNIKDISQEEAQELISDDGYFGVEQTSDRIVDFAISLAGGDVSRLDAIKEGVENGFNEALDAFGGWLPEISYDTYDTVMEKLDAWAAESIG